MGRCSYQGKPPKSVCANPHLPRGVSKYGVNCRARPQLARLVRGNQRLWQILGGIFRARSRPQSGTRARAHAACRRPAAAQRRTPRRSCAQRAEAPAAASATYPAADRDDGGRWRGHGADAALRQSDGADDVDLPAHDGLRAHRHVPAAGAAERYRRDAQGLPAPPGRADQAGARQRGQTARPLFLPAPGAGDAAYRGGQRTGVGARRGHARGATGAARHWCDGAVHAGRGGRSRLAGGPRSGMRGELASGGRGGGHRARDADRGAAGRLPRHYARRAARPRRGQCSGVAAGLLPRPGDSRPRAGACGNAVGEVAAARARAGARPVPRGGRRGAPGCGRFGVRARARQRRLRDHGGRGPGGLR